MKAPGEHEKQDVVGLGQECHTEDRAITEELTTDTEQRQTQRKAETDTDTVEE